MFEHRSKPLISRKRYVNRVLQYGGFASAIIAFSLWIGMVGYHFLAGIDWVDSFYTSTRQVLHTENIVMHKTWRCSVYIASMILTGMGPALNIDALPLERQNGVKIFAGFYALYSGVVFLASSGLLLSPILHRFFHKLHIDITE